MLHKVAKKSLAILLTVLTVLASISTLATVSFAAEENPDPEKIKSFDVYKQVDLNGDGKFNLKEVKILLRVLAKLEDYPTEYEPLFFDISNNGVFNTLDVKMFMRILAKLPPIPPKTTVPSETTTRLPETTTMKPVTTTKKPVPTTKSLQQKMTPKYSSSNVTPRFKESVVYDLTNDQMLYAYNAKAWAFPASITKIVTAYVASLYVPMDKVFTVGSELSLMDWNSSTAGLYQGYRLTMEQLIACLLIPSGCDAAYTIAVSTARYITGKKMTDREALNYFVKLMNTTATKIGCINSNFVNPSGFPADYHYSCAYDICLFAKHCNQNKTIKRIVSWHYKNLKIASGQTIYLENTNYLIDSYSSYYYKGAYGMKTGTTTDAGRCLVALAKRNNRELAVVILGGYDQSARYRSAINYFDYFFAR